MYWLTNTGVSSARLYWENKAGFFAAKKVSIPFAISVFPDELYQAPRSWAERAYPNNLIHYNRLDKGGHFAAWEQPQLFSEEMRTGFSVPDASPPRQLPSFGGATGWLNSEPLRATELRGRVVLVDFWTLTCINWLRTEPYVRAWWQAYRGDGLVVIGVHTPEFSFEHELELVREATRVRAIDYPVALDNDYGVWQAFDNHYWPALYFTDTEGVVRYEHFGEGAYEQSERLIQQLLGVERELVAVQPSGVEAQADWEQLATPETYLGYQRGERFASRDGATYGEPRAYELPDHLNLNHWGLAGAWTVGAERVATDQGGGGIAYRFHARDAHLVMSSDGGEPIPFRVLLDGQAPGASHGEDVDATGAGVLEHGRLYQLVRTDADVRDRTLEITFAEPGAEAYVFTFG